MSQSDDTLLTVSGLQLGPWASRGAKHVLAPRANGVFWEDVNGGGHFSARVSGVKKYSLTVTAADVAPPALDGISLGSTHNVACAGPVRLYVSASTAAHSVTIERSAVSGSVKAYDTAGATIAVTSSSGTLVDLPAHSAGFVEYRPTLSMILTELPAVDFDEWEAGIDWTLRLEEA
jgi:hypothetical protein